MARDRNGQIRLVKRIVAAATSVYPPASMLNDRSSILSLLETRRSGKPRELFAETVSRAHLTRGYSVAADGESFLVVRDVDRGTTRPRITVVENWFAEFSPSARR